MQGYDGERAVGAHLEEQRPEGWRISHDLPGHQPNDKRKWNIDHVLIGPAGVFVIETKTYSKPEIGSPEIAVTGDTIQVDRKPATDAPIRQVQSGMSRIAEIVQDETGDPLPADCLRGIVAFPGWYIKGKPDHPKIWVLEPKGIWKWIAYEPNAVLSPARVKQISNALKRYAARD